MLQHYNRTTISKKKLVNLYCLDLLYDNNFYVGHLTKKWNIYMSFFILYKTRKNYLFNMFKLLNNLKRSIFFLINICSNRGKVFFIEAGTRYKNFYYFFKKITKQFFLGFKWIGGLITNFQEFFIFQKKYKRSFNLNIFWILKKKGYFKNLTRLPDVALFVNGYRNKIALTELQLVGVPLVASISSEDNPSGINFVLANGNCEFYISLLYLTIFIESIILGYIFERNFFF